jgi:hypothetical protein
VRSRTRKHADGHLLYDVLGLALTALIVLKLSGVVTWSWWWVLAPLWINLALGLLVLAPWVLMILILRRELKRHWFAWRGSILRDQRP